jgi:hypothetical protein
VQCTPPHRPRAGSGPRAAERGPSGHRVSGRPRPFRPWPRTVPGRGPKGRVRSTAGRDGMGVPDLCRFFHSRLRRPRPGGGSARIFGGACRGPNPEVDTSGRGAEGASSQELLATSQTTLRPRCFPPRDERGRLAVVLTAPPYPFLPADAHGQLAVALAVCYAGDLDEGERCSTAAARVRTASGGRRRPDAVSARPVRPPRRAEGQVRPGNLSRLNQNIAPSAQRTSAPATIVR